MNRFFSIGLVAIAAVTIGLNTASAQEFESLFNGKDLTGWAGRSEFWSVRNGAILGETTADNPLKAHMFLVWGPESGIAFDGVERTDDHREGQPPDSPDHKVSMMPPGLIHVLNQQELLDLNCLPAVRR